MCRVFAVLFAIALTLLSPEAMACVAKKPSPYAGTFYANDFSYLEGGCDPENDMRDRLSRFTDQAKRLKFSDTVIADFGGEFRLRYHDENNHALSRLDGLDNTFFLRRLRLYGNLEFGSNVRLYGEFIDARVDEKELGVRSIEEVHTDLLNGFVDFYAPVEAADLTLRLGRQELLFGAQRLISPLDWGNTRRSFDGARLDFSLENLQLSTWYAAPREITTDFESRTDDDNRFFGLYSTYRFAPGLSAEGYALNLSSDLPSGADRNLWTIGGRHAGRRDGFFWEIEAAGQFGELDGVGTAPDTNIRAWMLTAGAGYTFKTMPWQPKLSVYYDRASGDDDPNDDTFGTFNQLFPLAHAYFGFVDLVGRQNIDAVSLRLAMKPHHKLKLGVAAHQFWLADSNDALFNSGGGAIRRDASGVSGRNVGAEIDITATAQLLDNVNLEFGYSHFFGGSFVDATNPVGVDGDADFFYGQFRVRF